MNNKKMREKIEQLEAMLVDIQSAIDKKEDYDDDYIPEDKESDYTRDRRKQITTTVPDWVVDHCHDLLVEFNDKIHAFHYNKITISDLIRSLVYAAMLNPDSVPLSTYDEIKHLNPTTLRELRRATD